MNIAENISTVVILFAGVLVLIGAAAFIWAYYLVSLNKNQIEALRGDRDDLMTRVDLLEKDRERLSIDAAKKDSKLAEAQSKITVLEGIVTHDASINELIRTVNNHDENVEKRYDEYMKIISQVLQAVEIIIERQDVIINASKRSG